MSETTGPGDNRPRTGVLLAALVGLVLLVLAVWLVARAVTDGDEGDDGGLDSAAGGTSGSPSAQPSSPFPSTSVGADGQPLPSKEPGQTAPTEVVTPGTTVAPVRARLGSPADLGDGVVARVTRVEAVEGKGRGPGEVSGPSLRFTVEVRNGSSKQLRTIASGLTAFYGPQARPAIDLSAPGVVALPTEIAPGDVGRGRYVFLIPEGARDQLRLDFSYGVSVPKVVFVGGR